MYMKLIKLRGVMLRNCLNLTLCKNLYFRPFIKPVSLLTIHSTNTTSKHYSNQRPPGGGRSLNKFDDVFLFNNWDNVEWDAEQEAEARKKVEANSQQLVTMDKQAEYESEADRFWDDFYGQHQNRFFKDRHWLFTEFPELLCGMEAKVLDTIPRKVDKTDDSSSMETGSETMTTTVPTDTEHSQQHLSVDRLINDHGDTLSHVIVGESRTNSETQLKETDSRTNSATYLEKTDSVTNTGNDLGTELKGTDSRTDIAEKHELRTETELNKTELRKKEACRDCNKSGNGISNIPSDNADKLGSSKGVQSAGEFPGQHGTFRVFEVGCGVGNTVFPILQTNNDRGVFVYCCDLSATAIQLVKDHADYDPHRCHAFVCDVTDADNEFPFPDESLDVITLIFVLSAIHPDKMRTTIERLGQALRPGGVILFRDYGRYDLAQLRFKNGRCLSENFYVRGDGTRVYFFTQEELRDLFTSAGLEERQNYIDRRLQVNRGKMLKMYRVWVQCKYVKPIP